MTYKATLDKTAKLITSIIPVLFIGIIMSPKLFSSHERTTITTIIITVILCLLYAIAYAYSPIEYELTKYSLIIKRPLKNVVLHRSQIIDIKKLENGKLLWSLRTFGSGGAFGYFGLFWNKEFGNMNWYSTRRDKAIMIITTSNKKIVISPDETDEFMQAYTELARIN